MFHCIFDFNIMKTDNRNNSISLQLQFWFPAFIKSKRDKAALFIGPIDGVHMTSCKIYVKDEESRANRRNNLVHRHVREGANTWSHVSCGYHEHSLSADLKQFPESSDFQHKAGDLWRKHGEKPVLQIKEV